MTSRTRGMAGAATLEAFARFTEPRSEQFEVSPMTIPRPSEPTCRLCALGPLPEGNHVPFDTSTLVAHSDCDLIALLRRDLGDVLVAPSLHVSRLSALPGTAMAQFLATLRRIELALQAGDGSASLRTVELLGAPGHTCIRVPTHAGRDAPLGESQILLRLKHALYASSD
jgi:hypothetical protein